MTTTDRPSLLILGGGGHAAVVADTARAAGWSLRGYLDDTAHDALTASHDLPHLGTIADLDDVLRHTNGALALFAAVGDASLRRQWLSLTTDDHIATLIHPSAVVSPTTTVAPGVLVGAHAVVNARAVIGCGAIVNTSAVVEHDVRIGSYAHLAPGSIIAGEVTIEDDALIGAGAVVHPGRCVERGATVGAGAVVVENVSGGCVVGGVPARPINATRARTADSVGQHEKR